VSIKMIHVLLALKSEIIVQKSQKHTWIHCTCNKKHTCIHCTCKQDKRQEQWAIFVHCIFHEIHDSIYFPVTFSCSVIKSTGFTLSAAGKDRGASISHKEWNLFVKWCALGHFNSLQLTKDDRSVSDPNNKQPRDKFQRNNSGI
jgi:hypothetical protein